MRRRKTVKEREIRNEVEEGETRELGKMSKKWNKGSGSR